MGVYDGTQIEHALQTGDIICTPLNSAHIGPISLDITLGNYYFRAEQANDRVIYNPLDREDTERFFDGPYMATPHANWAALNGFKPLAKISDTQPVIAIKPGERILVHSHEFIGVKSCAAQLSGRSGWERNGIAISAGWICPGFLNRLTLSIINLNERETIVLPIGERIAQITFFETTANTKDTSQTYTGSYQPVGDLETIIKTWSPDLLLPKSYRDSRSVPLKIEGLSYE